MRKTAKSIVVLALLSLALSCLAEPAKEPKYSSEKPLYAKVVVNEDGSKILSVVFDESQGTGKGYDVLYADVNFNGKFDRDERFGTVTPQVMSYGHPIPGWSSSNFAPIVLDVPYNEKGEGVPDPCKVTFRYQRYPIAINSRFGFEVELDLSYRPPAPTAGKMREEFNVEATVRLQRDGAIWEYSFEDILRPSERIENVVAWRFGAQPGLEVSTRPDGRKKGNLGIGLELKAGGRRFQSRKGNSPPEAQVEIKDLNGKVVHRGSAALDKFVFG